MTTPRFHRVASGDYETADGRYRLYRLVDVNPPAWNVEDVVLDDTTLAHHEPDGLLVDGAASKRDALAIFAVQYATHRQEAK